MTQQPFPTVVLLQNPLDHSTISHLENAGYTVRHVSEATEAEAQVQQEHCPVVVPLKTDDPLVATLSEHLLSHAVAWAEDPGALTPYFQRGGRAFLLPPFSPELVQAQIEARRDHLNLRVSAQDVARQVELKLIERDVEIGRDIQLSFLPQTLPERPGWELCAFFKPAREVAGDFYDSFELLNGRRIGIVMADVCDKGVPAAIFMALFRTLIRAGAQQNISLSWADPNTNSGADDKVWLSGLKGEGRQALPRIGTSALQNAVGGTNNYMTQNHGETGYFVTLFFGIFDPQTGQLIYVNGGHNPPVIVRADGTQVLLKPTGPAVGMIPGANFKIAQETLHPGDTLFTYTDGVTDAKNSNGEFFSMHRVTEMLKGEITSAHTLMESFKAALKDHIQDAPQFDDITMMVVRRSPNP